MKNPQRENGFTGIANELMDAVCKLRISGEEMQIFHYVFRMTYGYNRKSAKLELKDFVKGTGLIRQNAYRALKQVLFKKLVIKIDDEFVINKDYQTWKPVIKTDYKSNQKRLHLMKEKESNKEKEIILKKKEILTNVSSDKSQSDGAKLNLLLAKFKLVNPNVDRLYKNKTQREALQRQIDKFSYEKIENLLNQLPAIMQDQYAPQITTPLELESKMGKLVIHVNQKRKGVKSVDAAEILHRVSRQGSDYSDPRGIPSITSGRLARLESSVVSGQDDLDSTHYEN